LLDRLAEKLNFGFSRFPSLRVSLTFGGLVSSFVAALSTLAFLSILIDFRNSSQTLAKAYQGVAVAQEIAEGVRSYHQDAQTSLSAGELRIFKMKQDEFNNRVRPWLLSASRYVDTREEGAMLDKISAEVRSVLNASALVFASDVETGQRTQLESRLWSLESDAKGFVSLNQNQVDRAEKEIESDYVYAKKISVVTVICVVLFLFMLAIVIRFLVYAPFLALSAKVSRFGNGEFDSRFAPKGPLEIRNLGGVFNEMASSLNRVRRDRIQMNAGIAHDIRNPVAAVKMTVSLLRANPDIDVAERQKRLAIVERQVERLDRLVGDLLESSKLEAGVLTLEKSWVDLRVLALEARDLFSDFSKNHQILSELGSEPVQCFCDPFRLSQVLNNLMSNAIKYSPAGGRILLRLGVSQALVSIEVDDEGIGIAPHHVKNIFEPFERVGECVSTVDGTGLGLFTSQKIVLAHGGHIEVVSNLGQGTTFKVFLPRGAVSVFSETQSSEL
jgi:two-component system, OmpR family, sensor histidine kinase MtrB